MYQKPPGERNSAAGRSLLEMLWEELDSVIDRLMADGKPGEPEVTELSEEAVAVEKHDLSRLMDDFKAWGEERGQAQGLAYAIAVITDPYEVDVPGIKKISAKRWEERQK